MSKFLRGLTVTLGIMGMTLVAATAVGLDRLAFSGGPEGGTFQYFSNCIAIRLSKNVPDVEVSNMASAGSLENLRRVNSGEADFGIVYSGDTYFGFFSADALNEQKGMGQADSYAPKTWFLRPPWMAFTRILPEKDRKTDGHDTFIGIS